MSFISLVLWTQLEIMCNVGGKHHSLSSAPSPYVRFIPQNRQYSIICSQGLCSQMSCDRHLPDDFIPQGEERDKTNSVRIPAAAPISINTLLVSQTSMAKTLKGRPRLLPLHLYHHTVAVCFGEASLNLKVCALALFQLSL